MISPRKKRLGEDVSGVSQALCLKVQQHLFKDQRCGKKTGSPEEEEEDGGVSTKKKEIIE